MKQLFEDRMAGSLSWLVSLVGTSLFSAAYFVAGHFKPFLAPAFVAAGFACAVNITAALVGFAGMILDRRKLLATTAMLFGLCSAGVFAVYLD